MARKCITKKEKLVKYNKDNPLGWSEEQFRDIICTMCQIKFLTGEPLTPLLNTYYLQEGDQWKKERLEKLLKENYNLRKCLERE